MEEIGKLGFAAIVTMVTIRELKQQLLRVVAFDDDHVFSDCVNDLDSFCEQLIPQTVKNEILTPAEHELLRVLCINLSLALENLGDEPLFAYIGHPSFKEAAESAHKLAVLMERGPAEAVNVDARNDLRVSCTYLGWLRVDVLSRCLNVLAHLPNEPDTLTRLPRRLKLMVDKIARCAGLITADVYVGASALAYVSNRNWRPLLREVRKLLGRIESVAASEAAAGGTGDE